ncbi:DUF881 domain-containing protein [Modestobacter muralis]|uniref:DUF881 domain-containing protein n=1 Tax=Modestobacter muralis TaxID=1608614 RepID=A0A6P0H932_9ACTN|nr:DUF881 domain-containing protein [Modestobacter muralis]NEN50584.1 DUF881 domain-containing protein [Modestobacter muralis]
MRRSVGSLRVDPWTALVPVVALVAGLIFATSGTTAQGTDLRAGQSSQLTDLIAQREASVADQQATLAGLQADVQALTDQAAGRNGAVAEAQALGRAGLPSAGLTALAGPGLTVTLDDAQLGPNGALPTGARPDDVVIHQSDVQGVVNALWAAGADGVSIMGRRLTATSAVICVGNTLLLQGRTYSPPFVVTAVGSAGQMRDQLDASEQVRILRDAADRYGLTYDVQEERGVTLAPYDGTLDMQYARTD